MGRLMCLKEGKTSSRRPLTSWVGSTPRTRRMSRIGAGAAHSQRCYRVFPSLGVGRTQFSTLAGLGFYHRSFS